MNNLGIFIKHWKEKSPETNLSADFLYNVVVPAMEEYADTVSEDKKEKTSTEHDAYMWWKRLSNIEQRATVSKQFGSDTKWTENLLTSEDVVLIFNSK